MGLFGRRRDAQDILQWQQPGIRSSDPAVLYQHGISCVVKSDGIGMMSTGWALWGMSSLDQHQAYDFLYDGYKAWVASGEASDEQRRTFLLAMFDRLADIQPAISPGVDLRIVPPAVAVPASVAYGARCWAGSELLEMYANPQLEQRVYEAFTATHPEFMPPRSADQYREMCEKRDLPKSAY